MKFLCISITRRAKPISRAQAIACAIDIAAGHGKGHLRWLDRSSHPTPFLLAYYQVVAVIIGPTTGKVPFRPPTIVFDGSEGELCTPVLLQRKPVRHVTREPC
ncbi:hypothetical protein BS47DRAFT_1164114 [Hydnum rufescens UP504]|uniref:Uncharacterized protein n=1 Tax=Hydnum rufescens UP504 TaxID=1448309 RepID=A0A9P6AVJ4_9AGAM|nr:hypothetical protein BS47DRAFT_1164114 [Hydnum rufescens UP504]